ncbi:hypothetical protein G2W53_040862 [Senna tora]|uniref:Uncharacterized protein n=1 Tax=Senna tora TaxID=362788 RepID=A0A834SE86_9FABA|nr:hypothetical protein G2W53_040862 [Senna tora]
MERSDDGLTMEEADQVDRSSKKIKVLDLNVQPGSGKEAGVVQPVAFEPQKEGYVSFRDKLVGLPSSETADNHGKEPIMDVIVDGDEEIVSVHLGNSSDGSYEEDSDTNREQGMEREDLCPKLEFSQQEYDSWCQPWRLTLLAKLMGKTMGVGFTCNRLEKLWVMYPSHGTQEAHEGETGASVGGDEMVIRVNQGVNRAMANGVMADGGGKGNIEIYGPWIHVNRNNRRRLGNNKRIYQGGNQGSANHVAGGQRVNNGGNSRFNVLRQAENILELNEEGVSKGQEESNDKGHINGTGITKSTAEARGPISDKGKNVNLPKAVIMNNTSPTTLPPISKRTDSNVLGPKKPKVALQARSMKKHGAKVGAVEAKWKNKPNYTHTASFTNPIFSQDHGQDNGALNISLKPPDSSNSGHAHLKEAQILTSHHMDPPNDNEGDLMEEGGHIIDESLIRDLKQRHKVDFMAILETRQSGDNASNIIRKMDFDRSDRVDAIGFSGGIWCMWNFGKLFVEVILKHPQFMHLRIRQNNFSWLFTVVYGSPNARTRRELWDNLHLQCFHFLSLKVWWQCKLGVSSGRVGSVSVGLKTRPNVIGS